MDGKSILVIDDSKSARFAMRRMLEALGCRVQTAESGEEGLRLLREARPDLVFLDHIMPVMEGLEVLGRIRQQPESLSVPVVICSSNSSGEFLQQVRIGGATDVLIKPPAPEQLAGIVERLAAQPAPTANGLPRIGRVQTIRDPEETIEQAVMKSLRDALPLTGQFVVAPAAEIEAGIPETIPPAPQPEPRTPAPVAVTSDAMDRREPSLRGEVETRLRHITQDVFAQLGEVRALVAHLEAQFLVAETGETERFADATSAIATRLDALAGEFAGFVDATRGQFGAMNEEWTRQLNQQADAFNRRMDQLAHDAHHAAIEEAHAVSERVVMNAARRISDQIAESVLAVLKPTAAQKLG